MGLSGGTELATSWQERDKGGAEKEKEKRKEKVKEGKGKGEERDRERKGQGEGSLRIYKGYMNYTFKN